MATTATPTKAPRTPRKPPATPRGTCSASITINRVRYALRPVQCDREAARQCFELRKADGTVYCVSRHDYGAECDCPDFIWSRDGIDPLGCKHVKALVALQILDTHAPHVKPVPPSTWDGDDSDDFPPKRQDVARGPQRHPRAIGTPIDDDDVHRLTGSVG